MSESHLPGFSLWWTLRNWRSFNRGRRAAWIILHNLRRREAACVQRPRGRTKWRTFITVILLLLANQIREVVLLHWNSAGINDKKLPDVSWDALSMSKNLMRVIYDHLHIECNSRCFTHAARRLTQREAAPTAKYWLWRHVGLCTHKMTLKASKV